MARIFISMSGEGRGHATRVRAIVEMLRGEHQLSLFAPGDAFDLLAPVYAKSEVRLERIPGLAFRYDANRRLDVPRTAVAGARYIASFGALRSRLEARIRGERPELVITDFEPALPRAAKSCGVPFLSINHQHFLLANELSDLPPSLRRHVRMMSTVVGSYYTGQSHTIISQFYFPPVKPAWRNRVTMAGVLLRPDVLSAEPVNRGHLLVYLRRFGAEGLMAALRSCGRPVKVYGLGVRAAEGNVTYHAIDERAFLADLASCDALVCTAGNQLVGEALYLNKPVLAMPEANNHEQFINAHYLRASGAGDWAELDRVDSAALERFLGEKEGFRSRIDRHRLNGNETVYREIQSRLPAPVRVSVRASMRELVAS